MTQPAVDRRHFVAIATSTFDDPNFANLKDLGDEVQALRTWLCDPALGDRAFTEPQPEFADNPLVTDVREKLGRPHSGQWTSADAAVVFITTHGWVAADRHWLGFQTTQKDSPYSTALATDELVGALQEKGITHVLLILDTCHAGHIAKTLPWPKDLSWIVLPSATEDEEAGVGILTGAITAFLQELRSDVGEKYGLDEYLTVGTFVQGIEKHLPNKAITAGYTQFAGPLYPTRQTVQHLCLPNPHYRLPDAAPTSPARRDLALPQQDLRTHWGPRSRGVTKPDEPGWLFSGRRQLMRRLIETTASDPRPVLVTGGAGSGKSAVLARLVTLSDATFRAEHADQIAAVPVDLLPREGAVDVAVLATGKNALEILTQVCQAVGATAPTATPSTLAAVQADWDAWITGRTEPVTIVVDALDEAALPSEVVTAALQPLLGEHHRHPVRLLVGVRCAGGTAPAETPREGLNRQLVALLESTLDVDPVRDRIRVDEVPWWDPADIRAYVASILLGGDASPYRVDPDAATAVAGVVADAAGTSFLVAKLAADQLAARREVVDPHNPAWRKAVEQGVLGVFREDLHHTLPDPYDRERAVHLLRAVAFAYGRGLPWLELWPLVANAVADQAGRYGDTDIAWLLSTRLGGYLVTDREDGVTVYRLFHDDLRTNLRERWRELLDEGQS